jgi:hypothetical protein
MADEPWTLVEIARWIVAAAVMLLLPTWVGLAVLHAAMRESEGAKSPLETFVHIRSARRRRK